MPVSYTHLDVYKRQEITLSGWVQNIRSSGKVAFVELRDGSGYIQCVAEPQFLGESFDEFASLGQESSLSITGIISKHPKNCLLYTSRCV